MKLSLTRNMRLSINEDSDAGEFSETLTPSTLTYAIDVFMYRWRRTTFERLTTKQWTTEHYWY